MSMSLIKVSLCLVLVLHLSCMHCARCVPGGRPGQSRLVEVYPPLTTVLPAETEYSHLFNDNYGAGAAINEDIGLYHTWQYALFKNVFGRLLVSKYRTRYVSDSHINAVFYVADYAVVVVAVIVVANQTSTSIALYTIYYTLHFLLYTIVILRRRTFSSSPSI
jgi:hypothetical protein